MNYIEKCWEGLSRLEEAVNAKVSGKIKLCQQDVKKQNMSFWHVDDDKCIKLRIMPYEDGKSYNVALSKREDGKELFEKLYSCVEKICGGKDEGSNQPNKREPRWIIDDFDQIEKIVYCYANLASRAHDALEVRDFIEGIRGQLNRPRKSGGEGKFHRRLKKHVAKNPQEFNILPPFIQKTETEHRLLSGDSVDVFFECEDELIAVEVKSHKSEDTDILRGVFQCVKYKAVLEAEQSTRPDKKKVRAILVLGGKFPSDKHILRYKDALQIEVLEYITHPA